MTEKKTNKVEPFMCKLCEGSMYQKKVNTKTFYKYKNKHECFLCRRSVYTLDQIKILGPFIIVVPINMEMITKAGIILPASMWRVWNIGKVAKLGEKLTHTCFKFNKRGKQLGKRRTFTRPDVKVEDIVLFQKQAPRGYDLGRGNIYFIHYEDVEIGFVEGTFLLPM